MSAQACPGWLAPCALALACAAPPSAWELERAERHLADGEPRRAFHYSERALQRREGAPGSRQLALHEQTLRALGRDAAADAFADFARRYAAGEDTYAAETTPSWRECTGQQEGSELVLDWGDRPIRVDYDPGTVAATFQVDAEGRVGDIRVLRARHPAAAWLIIDSIDDARISTARLARRRADAPESLPVELCAWWNLARGGARGPGGGCIRGGCTAVPGAPPR